jgi:hypothetical protein
MHKLTQKEIENYDQGFKLDLVLVEDTKDPYKLAWDGDARLQYDLTKDTL